MINRRVVNTTRNLLWWADAYNKQIRIFSKGCAVIKHKSKTFQNVYNKILTKNEKYKVKECSEAVCQRSMCVTFNVQRAKLLYIS